MTPSLKATHAAVFSLVFIIACSQSGHQGRGGDGDDGPTPAPLPQAGPGDSSSSPGRTRLKNDTVAGESKSTEILKNNKIKKESQVYPEASARPRVLAREAPADLNSRRMHPPAMALSIRPPSQPLDRENYAHFEDNPVKRAAEDPVSTFSIDVDTGSYANVRRMLNAGHLPRQDAVRAEELINYFDYDYPVPEDRSAPFAVYREIAPAPWRQDTYLLHIGVKGYDVGRADLPPANLVFLIDVSGSMNSPDKLELLKSSLRLLTRRLDEHDRVAIVVYAGASGVVLEPTPGSEKGRIVAALDRLSAGGSTNGASGIRLAYAMAGQGFIKDGINRVLLATDGDFNVGTVNIEQLKNLVEDKRRSGIALTTLGFGRGNYNDHLMEQLADIGNGNYAYIDNLNEAQKVLIDEMGSTLLTIAKDVKIQIEFNPVKVSEYRLIGYENRALKREDFNNDKVDAGDIGAGHTVTALYEIVLNNGEGRRVEPLRYGENPDSSAGKYGEELAFLRLRYKEPDSENSRLQEWPVPESDIRRDLASASTDFRFAAAVAAFAQMLRGGKYTDGMTWDEVTDLVKRSRGRDPFGYRGGFLSLVNMAASLQTPVPPSDPVARTR